MPDPANIDDVPIPVSGDPIRATDIAAIIRAAKAGSALPDSVELPDGVAQQQVQGRTKYLEAYTEEAIPAWSIFGIVDKEPMRTPQRINVAKIGLCDAGSHMAMFTNGPVAIPANRYGQAYAIDDSQAVRVRVTGTTPQVGSPCGVMLDTYGVTSVAQGFVCMSEPDANGIITVVRSREPVSLVLEITTRVSSYANRKMGSGQGQIMFRKPGGRLCPAKNPETQAEPWLMTVWSGSLTALDVGTKIVASSALGIGLVYSHRFDVDSLGDESSSSSTLGENPCEGLCVFNWVQAENTWVFDGELSTCTLNTSTTSTSSTSSSSSSEGQSDVEEDCDCDGGTTSTSSSTTSEPECSCEYPIVCGDEDGQCTYTLCTPHETSNTNEECPDDSTSSSTSTSTSTSTSSSTTTECPDVDCECVDKWCHWAWLPLNGGGAWGWHLQASECCDNLEPPFQCVCSAPSGSGTACEVRKTKCVLFEPGGGDENCDGACLWFCTHGFGNTWVQIEGNCSRTFNCFCVPPPASECDFCGYAETRCGSNPAVPDEEVDPCAPTLGETSCRTCSDSTHTRSCRYTCSDGGAWSGPTAGPQACLSGCECPAVEDADLGDCPDVGTSEVVRACCGEQDYTNVCDGWCHWSVSSMEWVLDSETCEGSCICIEPGYSPHDECEIARTPCAQNSGTTTDEPLGACCVVTAEGNFCVEDVDATECDDLGTSNLGSDFYEGQTCAELSECPTSTTSSSTTSEMCDNCDDELLWPDCGEECSETAMCDETPLPVCMVLRVRSNIAELAYPDCQLACRIGPSRAPLCQTICCCLDEVGRYHAEVTIEGVVFDFLASPNGFPVTDFTSVRIQIFADSVEIFDSSVAPAMCGMSMESAWAGTGMDMPAEICEDSEDFPVLSLQATWTLFNRTNCESTSTTSSSTSSSDGPYGACCSYDVDDEFLGCTDGISYEACNDQISPVHHVDWTSGGECASTICEGDPAYGACCDTAMGICYDMMSEASCGTLPGTYYAGLSCGDIVCEPA